MATFNISKIGVITFTATDGTLIKLPCATVNAGRALQSGDYLQMGSTEESPINLTGIFCDVKFATDHAYTTTSKKIATGFYASAYQPTTKTIRIRLGTTSTGNNILSGSEIPALTTASQNTGTTILIRNTFDNLWFKMPLYSTEGYGRYTSIDGLPVGVIYNNSIVQSVSQISSTMITNANTYSDYFNDYGYETYDPYEFNNDTSSGEGGGGGIGVASDTSEPIDFPDLPSLDAVSTGFINLFTPTLSQLQSLASWMWDDTNDIVNSILKLFTDPMEVILGLSLLGVSAPTSGSASVILGNVDTSVSMDKLSSQFFTIDCGTLNVEEIWGAYIDYSPYTKVSIYLPFIGTHQLNIDELMSKSVHLIYTIDALSGACVANIKCNDSVLYSFIGQCSASIPVTGNDYTNMINGIISIAGSVGSMIASGGATAPLVLPAMASNAVNNLKPNVEHSGAMAGTGGILGVKTAYLIFERPNLCLPSNQNKRIGYPSYIYENVGDLSGYTIFEEIKIQGNSHMTQGELEEIDKLMKAGVFL